MDFRVKLVLISRVEQDDCQHNLTPRIPRSISPSLMKILRPRALIFCLAITAATLRATTVIPPTFDQLVTEAEVILQGNVTDVRSQWIGEGAEHRIVTYVTLKVEEAIKGAPGDTYTIRLLGGTVDGHTMEVSDTPKFKIGDRDILFVEHNGSQFVPLVGIMHGRFHLQKEKQSGREIVAKDDGSPMADLAKLGKDERGATAGEALSIAAFKAAIHAKLGRNTP